MCLIALLARKSVEIYHKIIENSHCLLLLHVFYTIVVRKSVKTYYKIIKNDTCAWTPNKVFIQFLLVSVETARVLLQSLWARLSTGASREAPVDNECFSTILTTSNPGISGLCIHTLGAMARSTLVNRCLARSTCGQ